MSSRPVYIPPGRRNKNNKQQQQRFHGAFTGGFSAGYFNTVDTKEGWKPSNDTKKRQRLEDFMDEQDHEEWGGPTNVRREYNKAAATTTTPTTPATTVRSSSSSKNSNNVTTITKYQQDDSHNQLSNQESQHHHFSLDSLFSISHQSVGPRLLRRLGWREEGGNKAFVPSHDDDDDDDGARDNHGENDNNVSSSANIILSKKRLRKIKLQTSRINIPVPKLDVCGLGFDPHTNAPEFRQYFNRRKQLARERGVMIDGGSRSNNNNNVYRTSAIMMTTSNENDKNKSSSSSSNHHPTRDKQSNINKNVNQGDDYLSYETAEDFVGKRSVGGFALRDDEDDAYDKDDYRRPTRMQLGDEYNSEIYEHQDSDNDDDGDPVMLPRGGSVEADGNSIVQLHQKKTDLGGLLASWATTTAQQGSSSSTIGLTSDGRPPLEGFVLGGCMQSHKKRYPGPDIPREYVTRRHKFGENEHPLIFQTIARAVQLQEREKQRRDYNKRQHLQMTMLQQKSFSNLASAMKSRFITSSSKEEESKGPERIGLYMPESVVEKEGIESTTDPVKELTTAAVASEKPISIKRTVQSFLPHPLLCKRFGVPVPKNAIGIDPSQTNSYTQHPGRKQTEANYFEKEILTARTKNNNSNNNNKESSKGSTSGDNKNIQDDEQEDADEKPSGIQRPSMEKLKSIFEAQSDLESSDTDLDASSDDDDDDDDDEYGRTMNVDETVENPTATKGKEEESSQQMVVYEENDKGEQSDSSSSSTTTSSSSMRHRKEHRKRSHHRRHKSKKRRKRSRSPDDSNDGDDRKRRKERRRKHERRRRKKSSRRKER